MMYRSNYEIYRYQLFVHVKYSSVWYRVLVAFGIKHYKTANRWSIKIKLHLLILFICFQMSFKTIYYFYQSQASPSAVEHHALT